MTRITSVGIEALDLPLPEPFEISLGRQERAENVLVTVETEDGTVGYGEAAPYPPVTGETQAAAMDTLDAATSLVVGKSVTDYRAVVSELRATFPGMTAAVAGLEAALLDARCRRSDLSLAEWVGGTPTSIRTDYTIPLVPPDDARERASRAVSEGYEHLKIKAGSEPTADVARIEAVCDAAPDAELKVDANQGWTVAETKRVTRTLEDRGIALSVLEQPVTARNIRGLSQIRQWTATPVAADESVFSPVDALRLVEADAVDVLNVKLAKAGILGAIDIASIADAADLELMVGCMLESSIGIHTAAHLVAGTGSFDYVDLDGNRLIAGDVVPSKTGPVHELTGPGHGVTPAANLSGDRQSS